jgi:hypothetical protein
MSILFFVEIIFRPLTEANHKVEILTGKLLRRDEMIQSLRKALALESLQSKAASVTSNNSSAGE